MSHSLCKSSIEYASTEFAIHQVSFLKVMGHGMLNFRRYYEVTGKEFICPYVFFFLFLKATDMLVSESSMCMYMDMHAQT